MNSQKTTKWLFSSIPAIVVGTVIVVYRSDGMGTAIFAATLSFILLWCIYDLISHIVGDIIKGFAISRKEGHGRILLLLDVALGGIVGLVIDFITGLLLSLTLYCTYWVIVWAVRLIKRTLNDNF
ncbi:MAG: hypothetical protein ACYTFK_00365 [Planctomycetota bacterium]|jgi:hypothetical protein